MKLAISSAWYPVCVAVYLRRAALRAGHEVVAVGPSSGDTIPWERELTVPGFGVKSDVNDPIGAAAAARECDLWIDVHGGWFAAQHLHARRRVGVVTDPHCAQAAGDEWSGDTMRPYVSELYMMQSRYGIPGDKWLPYAYDPEWFRPAGLSSLFDFTNLGAPYPERVALSAELKRRGYDVRGPGRGAIGKDHAAELDSAPIAIVKPLSDDLPCRVFEAAALGVVVLTLGVFDLHALEAKGIFGMGDGCSIEAWADCAEELRGDIARLSALSLKWVQPHTWDARLAQLIEGRTRP